MSPAPEKQRKYLVGGALLYGAGSVVDAEIGNGLVSGLAGVVALVGVAVFGLGVLARGTAAGLRSAAKAGHLPELDETRTGSDT